MSLLKHKKLDFKASKNEFNEIVKDILEHEEVLKLHEYSQHFNTSRLQHSVNVAYYSYLVCKKFGWDYRSAARGGVLHDFFLYDWRFEKQPEGIHAFAHPKVALRNSRKFFEFNDIEADAVVNHMWPLTLKMPRYKESMVVSCADKFSTCVEICKALGLFVKSKQRIAKSMLFGDVLAK